MSLPGAYEFASTIKSRRKKMRMDEGENLHGLGSWQVLYKSWKSLANNTLRGLVLRVLAAFGGELGLGIWGFRLGVKPCNRVLSIYVALPRHKLSGRFRL